MENTLLVGDFLVVSKMHYGARTPSTLGIPFTRVYLPGIDLPSTRLPGFAEPERGDVAVFNYPASFDVVRGRIPETVPVERRDPYIKRLVAMPGDTLAVLDKMLHVNGIPQPPAPTMKQRWTVTMTGASRPTARTLTEQNITFIEGSDRTENGTPAVPRRFGVVASEADARRFERRADVSSVTAFTLPEGYQSEMIYPQSRPWNPDQYGPIRVPQEGLTVALTDSSWTVYEEVIERYEGRRAERSAGGGFLIDGRPATEYTFSQDYYFAMGDNRDNSVDGRYWGFVPHSHLVGKATMTLFSFDTRDRLLGIIPTPRVERFFRLIP